MKATRDIDPAPPMPPMPIPSLARTRRIMEAMFATLADCQHDPRDVREVLRQWGFVQLPVPHPGDVEADSWLKVLRDKAAMNGVSGAKQQDQQ